MIRAMDIQPMALLLAAALAFVGGHFILSSGPVRRPLAGALGEGTFTALYSLFALATLVWLAIEFKRAPVLPLWALAYAQAAPVAAMPFALLLLVCGLTQRNPTAVGQSFAAAADPAPGILRVTRHPVMCAFALWALSHLVPNGDVSSIIFFGGIAALAIGGMVAIDAKRRARDPEGFARFAAATSRLPFAAILAGRARFDWSGIGWWRALLAAALYAAAWHFHVYLSGVPVTPIQ